MPYSVVLCHCSRRGPFPYILPWGIVNRAFSRAVCQPIGCSVSNARAESIEKVDIGVETLNTVVPTHYCKRSSSSHFVESIPSSTVYMGSRTLDTSTHEDELIPYKSEKGKSMLVDCLRSSSGDVYLSLSEQFLTQSSPPSCGVATLAMVLNSLRVDPGRVWRKPWRWFTEEMLVSCFPLEKSLETLGLTIEHFGLIAECNGAVAQTFYGSNTSLEDFRSIVRALFSGSRESRLVVAFDRAVLGQTGTGHYSPIGAYHEQSDMVLVMDVARFKYPPYWVLVETMWRAMRTVDPETHRSRGFFAMSAAPKKDHRTSPIPKEEMFGSDAFSSFMDRSNLKLKATAAQLVHDVRQRMLLCPTLEHKCETIIDCSSYKNGDQILPIVRDSPIIQRSLVGSRNRLIYFTAEEDMRPIDFFIQSMPQLVDELITLCIIESGGIHLISNGANQAAPSIDFEIPQFSSSVG